jgi:hypothetical protein
MNQKKLAKIERELDALRRRGGVKSIELESLAQKLGRVPFKRGSEPTWVSSNFPDKLYPLSIPHHSGDLNKFTARSIIEQLELDIEQWELVIEEEKDNGEGNENTN